MTGFDSASVALLLEADPRPTFVLAEQNRGQVSGDDLDLAVTFCNTAFRSEFGDTILTEGNPQSLAFLVWAFGGQEALHKYCHFSWSKFPVVIEKQLYYVISAVHRQDEPRLSVNRLGSHVASIHDANMAALRQGLGTSIIPELETHLRLIEATNWDAASLGLWPPELLETIRMILILPEPAAIVLGDASQLLYNQQYASRFSGDRHSQLLGQPLNEAWLENDNGRLASVNGLGPQGRRVFDTLTPYVSGAISDNPEEWYSTWTVLTLSETLRSSAILSANVTSKIIEDRRRSILDQLRQKCAKCNSLSAIYQSFPSISEFNPLDIPFALLYSCKGALADSQARLEAMAPSGPQVDSADVSRLLEDAMLSTEVRLLSTEDGTLPVELQDLAVGQGFGTRARNAIIFCLRSALSSQEAYGIIILGLNPRQRLDESHRTFVDAVVQEITVSFGDIRYRQKATEQEHTSTRTLDAFARMLEMTEVGMLNLTPAGVLLSGNNAYHTLSGHPRDTEDMPDYSFAPLLHPEDAEMAMGNWAKLVAGIPVNFDFRYKWQHDELSEEQRDLGGQWVNATCLPLFDENGDVEIITGCMIDVSAQKTTIRALELARVAEERRAVEQERFIDMTSHELRNPLSAVVQSADVVLESLDKVLTHARNMLGCTPKQAEKHFARLREELDTGLESAQTIEACSVHQKRIIDDILTLSKLDSKLLTIAPSVVRFTSSIRECTKMFQSAAEAQSIELVLESDPSLQQLGIDWVKIDGSRMNQVIINLLTNAIKFTQTNSIRKITVRCGATRLPPDVIDNVSFPHQDPEEKQTRAVDEAGIYLWCSVIDTGSGFSGDQQDLLFKRFSQAFAPRTHSKYGGSGLGLFISRSLSELQGGQISVFSAGESKGSTFAFYIKAQTAAPPKAIDTTVDNLSMNCQKPDQESQLISVLVVEDNVVNSKVLAKQLQKQGFEVHVAYHGGEALDFIRTTKQWADNRDGPEISVILMDAEMPVMDGLTCTRNIRRLESEGKIVTHIPIIAVSANARVEQMDEMKEAGMDDAIAKPFRIPDLLPRIQRLVRRANLNAVSE